MKVCVIEGCESTVLSRGWCSRHYQRWHRWGDPVAGGPAKRDGVRPSSVEEVRDLRSTVAPDSGCWIWDGPLDRYGYGRMGLDKAHRVAYALANGPIPNGLVIDHLCRVRNCVNPAHMEAVTSAENKARGEGWAAVNARKTHCIHGHEFTTENTVTTSRGRRGCRTCQQIVNRKRWQQTKQRNAS